MDKQAVHKLPVVLGAYALVQEIGTEDEKRKLFPMM